MPEIQKKDILEYLQCMVNTETPTPLKIVNQMLDLIPNDVWLDDNAKILCPACKDGIFLREAVIRILRAKHAKLGGYEFGIRQNEILNQILRERIFGIAISYRGYRVTKRTLYTCRDDFADIDNIFFDETIGEYVKDKSGAAVERQSFHFIKNQNETSNFFASKGVENMKFDVIIGNPPYQLTYGTPGKNAFKSKPLYHDFIQQAINLEPKYISMIVPSKWATGTKELENFKKSFINDVRISKYHDIIDDTSVFKTIFLGGGVCYFLWDKNKTDKNVNIKLFSDIDTEIENSVRPMNNGTGTFSRFLQGDQILQKTFMPHNMSSLVSSWAIFGVSGSLIKDKTKEGNKFFYTEEKNNTIPIYSLNHTKDGNRFKWYYVDKNAPFLKLKNIEKWKLVFPKTMGGSIYRRTFIVEPGKIFTDTWVNVFLDTEQQCKNLDSYFKTFLFRYLLKLRCANQNIYKQVYELIPDLSNTKNPRTGKVGWDSDWTDDDLKKLFNLSDKEMEYIKSEALAADNGRNEEMEE